MNKWLLLTLISSLGTTSGLGLALVHAGNQSTGVACEIRAQKTLGDAAEVVGTSRRKLNLELLDQTQKSLNRVRGCMRADQKKIDQNLTRLLGRIRAEVLYDIPVCDGENTPVRGCTAEGWPLHLAPPQQRQICNSGLWGSPKNH